MVFVSHAARDRLQYYSTVVGVEKYIENNNTQKRSLSKTDFPFDSHYNTLGSAILRHAYPSTFDHIVGIFASILIPRSQLQSAKRLNYKQTPVLANDRWR
jgi:hypothetical protein